MKKTLKFIALLGSAFMIASCAQTEPPVDDNEYCNEDYLYTPTGHPFVSEKIEATYRSKNADYNLGGKFEYRFEIYGSAQQLKDSKDPAGRNSTCYSMWDDHNETENFGFDPFLNYDDKFFEDHILLVYGVDLAPNVELYFGGLGDKLEQEDGVNGGDPYYQVKIDEVKPTDEVLSRETYNPVYHFIPVEVPEDTTVDEFYAKYKNDTLMYWKWEVILDELSHCYTIY